ncbi:hypothetical protein PENSPDRAFT_635060 [Peniophora sp. CONT]|nr:hypothetical protein PENSPDRAFT_635060 [Peniophora sp. CONT]
MLKEKTPHAIYGGIGLEKPYTSIIVAWDKTETHNEFIKSSDYPILGERLVPLLANPKNPGLEMFHAHYDSDPTALFDAPITEFAIATVKSGVSTEEAHATIESIAKKVGTVPGIVGAVVGKIEEAPDRFVMVVGRKTRQDGTSEDSYSLADGKVDFTVEWAQFTKKQ